MIQYEKAARRAEQKVVTALEAMEVNWEEVSVAVPTIGMRTFARHTL